MLLILKLTLVPTLVLAATLATRRWGPRIGGLLTGFPIVSGPALLFFALEQGDAFAAEASRAVLASLVGVSVCAVAYAWASLRMAWWASLPISWLCFFAVVVVVQRVHAPAPVALLVALASFVLAQALLPPAGAFAAGARPVWDLPVRMIASMTLVVSVTSLAARLGPTLSGALTPFPVALSILMGFTHAQQGAYGTITFLRGFMPGMWSFAAFCFVLSVALVTLGTTLGFFVALAATTVIQAAVLRGLQRTASTRLI
jgi:hypothetical protein